jgi:aspartate kinase
MSRCVEYARRNRVPIRVRSSYSDDKGTLITRSRRPALMERAEITAIAHDRGTARITLVGLPRRPDAVARVCEIIARSGVEIRTAHWTSGTTPSRGDMVLVVLDREIPALLAELGEFRQSVGFDDVHADRGIATVTIAGSGLGSDPLIMVRLCTALAGAGISIDSTTSAEFRISAVVGESQLDEAVRVLHDHFGLTDRGNDHVHPLGKGRRARLRGGGVGGDTPADHEQRLAQ